MNPDFAARASSDSRIQITIRSTSSTLIADPRKSEATGYYDLCVLSLAVKTGRNDCVRRKQLPVGTPLPRRSLSAEGRRNRDGKLRGHLSAHRGAATYGFSIGFVPGPMVDSPAQEDGFELAVPPRRERLWAATPGKHCRFGPQPVSGSAFHAAVLASSEEPFAGAGPMVRIRFPPAESPQTFGSARPLAAVLI